MDHSYARELIAFMDASPTCFHAIETIRGMGYRIKSQDNKA